MNTILFKPANIKNLQLKNRFVRSATMEGMATSDGLPTQELKELYCMLADAEVGLIITSGTIIEPYKYFPNHLSTALAMDDNSKIAAWQGVIDAVHDRGAKIAMQLTCLGRQDIPEWRGAQPIAPSAVPIQSTGVTPREMTVADIQDRVEKFAHACRRAKEAGFDAVQLHGAHGNLINNFMSPFTNIRTDDYGGSTENRARFVTEIVDRTRELIGPDFPVMIKMNFNDFIDGGLDADEAVKIAEVIAAAGIDCIEVSGGTQSESNDHIAVKGIAETTQEAYFRPYAEALKPRVSIPVILVGGHRTPGVMADIIKEGAADFIAMSRPLIREPGLVKQWKDGRLEKANCISCNQCFDNWIFRPLRCYAEAQISNGDQNTTGAK